MYELDDVIHFQSHIVNFKYSLCGCDFEKYIYLSGYRHKLLKDIKCKKCKEIYIALKDRGYNNYDDFMNNFAHRYYTYETDKNIYDDYKNNNIDFKSGISSYSCLIRKIINKVIVDNKDIEILKKSNEVLQLEVKEYSRYDMFKGSEIIFTLIHGDKIRKATKEMYCKQELT